MIQQKGEEMIMRLPEELNQGLEHASQSQLVFGTLAKDKSAQL